MESMAAISDSAAAGVLGANDTNQPPTSPRTDEKTGDDTPTTVLACRSCRLRKVRCDSVRPICKNCTRRSEPCEYDVVPKRRGPDRRPGSRHRLYRKKPEDAIFPKRLGKSTKESTVGQHELQGPHRTARKRVGFSPSVTNPPNTIEKKSLAPPSTSTSNGVALLQIQHPSPPACDDRDLDASLRAVGFESLESLLSLTRHGFPTKTSGVRSTIGSGHQQGWTTTLTPWQPPWVGSYSTSTDGHLFELLNPEAHIPRGPSASFHKQTWWDSLLSLYSEDPSQSAVNVYRDLDFLLDNAIYWLSFINYRRFMDNLYDSDARILMQPSLVLSALALSTLMKSSETGLGENGRKLSLWLRDAAQSSLEASINASWIEPSLAQAAFFLALFEASSHPTHSAVRTTGAIFMLDSLIQALQLTIIDAHEPTVTIFPVNEIPRIASHSSRKSISGFPHSTSIRHETGAGISRCTCGNIEAIPSILDPTRKGMRLMAPALKSDHSATPDEEGLLEVQWERTRSTASWPDLSDVVEVQKEESRRLCWSSMMLISALREYTPLDFGNSAWDLHVTKHESFALFFPGEKSCKTNPKESIWALHSRAAILWNCCQQLRSRPEWDYRRDEIAGQAWMETTAIEEAQEQHQCPEGHGVPYAGREYVLQLKLLISNQFTTPIPLPHTLGQEKNSAREWLAHRAGMARHVRKLAYFVARFGATVPSLALAKRPLSIWWAMYQIKAGIQLWKTDPSLTDALEQSLEFLAVADFMSAMWPSEPQRRCYDKLRNDLMQCCVSAGIRVPAAIPIPGLPTDRKSGTRQ